MKNLALLSLIFSCYIGSSCKNMSDKSGADLYIMPQHIAANEDGRMEYYLTYHFIFDTGSHIYFYQREPYFNSCGYVSWWQEIRIPPYIRLEPKDLLEVPHNHLEEFTKLNILNANAWKREVIICAPTDTVVSIALANIMKIFKDTINHIKWKFRKTTQEEDIVLSYKKTPYSYYRDNRIRWDSTKILFLEVLEKIIKEERNTLLASDEKEPLPNIATDSFARGARHSFDSTRFKKLAVALNMKVEDLYMLENGD